MPGICPGISRRKRPGKGSSPHPRRPGGQFHRGVNHEPHQEQVGPPRFQVGNKVRVEYGVIVPDFPDIPLGGWTGTVTEVEQTDDQITYEIKWDKSTLNGCIRSTASGASGTD